MGIRPTMLLALGLLAGLTPFAIDMYLPSIPTIARDLDSSVEVAQLSVTIYLGVFALAQLFLGPLSDVVGRRATITGGLAVFLASSLACGLAPEMGFLLTARGAQAIGGAAVAVTVPALVRDLFEKDEYALVTGLIMLVMGIAPLVAPTLGGIIVSHGSWRWVFLALSGIAFATSLLFLRLVHETLPAERRHGFDVGHILRNYLRLLRHRAGLGYLVTGAASFSGMLVFIVTSPYVYIELYGVPTEYFGLLFGVNVLLAMIVSSLNARYVKRLGAEWLLRLGLAVQLAAALAMLALALVGGSQPLWPVASGAALYIGMSGLVLGNATAGFMSFFPRLAGTASAFSGTLRFGLGATVGTIVSLFHSETAAPLLVGMAACGLTAVGSYWLVCSAISTDSLPD